MLLPTPFVQATLIALDLPRDLADRYAEPELHGAAAAHDHEPLPQLRPDHAPPWPFPATH